MFLFAVAWVVERRHPIEPNQPKSEIFLDYELGLASVILARAFAPITGVTVAMEVNKAGGGLIALRADGWWFPLSLGVVLLAVELQAYWFHRLQRCVPFLWSMHSLHHSAEAMSAATSPRKYWVEQAILSAFLPNVAMLFKVPAEVLLCTPYIFITEHLAHMNFRVPLGPLMPVFNNPQFHRIHHSVEPQHYDKNFVRTCRSSMSFLERPGYPVRDEFPRAAWRRGRSRRALLRGSFGLFGMSRWCANCWSQFQRRRKGPCTPSPDENSLDAMDAVPARSIIPSRLSCVRSIRTWNKNGA